jgi:hypothetical protein
MLCGELPKRYPASGINDPILVGGKSKNGRVKIFIEKKNDFGNLIYLVKEGV